MSRTHGSRPAIALGVNVTKGAIYGHFSSKEDLLLSAIETAPMPDYGAMLNDLSRPLRERLAEFGRAVAADEAVADKAELAVNLEFMAALLRSPDDLRRYGAKFERRLAELAAADEEQPLPGVIQMETGTIGYALFAGLRIYQFIAPQILTPAAWARASELLAGLYPDHEG